LPPARLSAGTRQGPEASATETIHAHGTRYALMHEPFVAFDLMVGHERLPYAQFWSRAGAFFPTPHVVHVGGSFGVAETMAALGSTGFHGALDPVEGAVWRVERETKDVWAVDFLVKWVRPDKVDGLYLPEVTGGEPVWNWRPR